MPELFADEDPVDVFVRLLGEASRIKGFVEVYSNPADLARTTATGRIVIYPEDGDLLARNKAPAPLDCDLRCVAELWGDSRAHCWLLLRRLVHGVKEIARGSGPLVRWEKVNYDTDVDSSKQGQALSVRFVLVGQAIEDPTAESVGLVEKVTHERVN